MHLNDYMCFSLLLLLQLLITRSSFPFLGVLPFPARKPEVDGSGLDMRIGVLLLDECAGGD